MKYNKEQSTVYRFYFENHVDLTNLSGETKLYRVTHAIVKCFSSSTDDDDDMYATLDFYGRQYAQNGVTLDGRKKASIHTHGYPDSDSLDKLVSAMKDTMTDDEMNAVRECALPHIDPAVAKKRLID